jgi:hypothetical protein
MMIMFSDLSASLTLCVFPEESPSDIELTCHPPTADWRMDSHVDYSSSIVPGGFEVKS